MAIRVKKIYKQFLAIVILFSFSAVSIQFLPRFREIPDVLGSFVAPKLGRSAFKQASVTPTLKPGIWDIRQGEDRIQDQVKFKPMIDKNSKPKKILVQYGTGGWGLTPGRRKFQEDQCNVQNCELLDNVADNSTIHARLFKEIDVVHNEMIRFSKQIPRPPEQVWIMFALESPMATPNFEGVNHFINWTATYRPDSTIVTPYEKWVPFENFTSLDKVILEKNYANGKKKKAAMFVSNCPTGNNRLDFVHELQKHMQVDVYGACGDLTCARESRDDCFNMLRTDYKFYLAFENANCRHYITEKLFLNALQHDILPVVMGAHPDDYRLVAPPHSYIHIEDFKTAKDLADYLLVLDADDKLYNEYFKWKEVGHFINTKFWCRMCAMLWDPRRPTLSVSDLELWWRWNNTVCIGDRRWTN